MRYKRLIFYKLVLGHPHNVIEPSLLHTRVNNRILALAPTQIFIEPKILEPIIEEKEIRPTRTLEENLLKSNFLTKNDLYLKNVNLSPKEALCAHFYLQGMSAKEIAGEMYVSRRTVEDYIKCIKQKLSVRSRSEFYAAMERVNLWRSIL